MTFEQAIGYLKDNLPIRRASWNKRDRVVLSASTLHFTIADIRADDWMIASGTLDTQQVLQCPACRTYIEINTKVER